MKDTQTLIRDLEATWDFESGFFGKLRQGSFDDAALKTLYETLDSIDVLPDTDLSKRLVSLLWYMPLFMSWQRERVEVCGRDIRPFDQAVNRVEASISRILGVP